MKKFFAFLLILTLVMFMVSCSSEDEKKEETKSEVTEEIESEVEETEESEEVESNASDSQMAKREKDLTLLETVKFQRPESVSFKVKEVVATGAEQELNLYIMGSNYRLEEVISGSVNVLIKNTDEGSAYMYVEGDDYGFKFSADEAHDYLIPVAQPEIEGKAFYEVLQRDKLDGNDVIYAEFREVTEDGDFLTKMWMSEEYQMPLKFQVFNGSGEMLSEITYTDIVVGADLSDKLIPPENIKFE